MQTRGKWRAVIAVLPLAVTIAVPGLAGADPVPVENPDDPTVEPAELVLISSSGQTRPAYQGSTPPDVDGSEGSGLLAWQSIPAEAATEPDAYVGTNTVFPPDERGQVTNTTAYPYRAIVRLAFDAPGGRGACTGFMISASAVATAGHCLHGGGAGRVWYSNYIVVPGQNGNQAPFGSCQAAKLWSVYGWVNEGKEKFDYGVIQLNCAIGNSTGWFGYWSQPDPLEGQTTKLTGYPFADPSKPDGTMWQSNGTVQLSNKNYVFYFNDMTSGQSGSPVYRHRSGCGQCAMAINTRHVHGGTAPHNTYNHGTRINDRVFTFLFQF